MRVTAGTTRPGGEGCFKIDLVFDGMRISRSSGTKDMREFRRRISALKAVYAEGNMNLLRAFKDGQVTMEDILNVIAEKRPGAGMDVILLRRNLWEAVEETVSHMPVSDRTTASYALSFQRLRQMGHLKDNAEVQSLVTLPWNRMLAEWQLSEASWNHLRRAVSRFLTVYLEDKFHPFRRQVMHKIPLRREQTRLVSANMADVLKVFWALDQTRPDLSPVFRTLLITGMRIGEYLQLDESSLIHDPKHPGIKITGRVGGPHGGKSVKNKHSMRIIAVDPIWWPTVLEAVPCPERWRSLPYHYLRRVWRNACDIANVEDLRVHDLRHLSITWALAGGAELTQVQANAGHGNINQTAEYAKLISSRAVASVMGSTMKAFLPSPTNSPTEG